MKNAILMHGYLGTPDNFWFAWLKRELAAQGFTISAPQFPDADKPSVAGWGGYALENMSFDSDTVLIGHSAGCPTILSILEKIDRPVFRTILVAGFIRLKDMKDGDAMLMDDARDWDKIKRNGRDFFMLNSDNDPWGCDHHQGEALRQKLGGTLIVKTGDGHFGSKVFDQPYDTFPLLKDICLLA
jgi:predicted alpha/beta hydrolase family esterase